ncbi:MAG: outer membrane beta-barrel protein [Bacteroidia bacterium]
MSSDQFERKLSERFADARISPRPEVWANIEKQLSTSRPKRRGGFWLLGDGVFAAILLLGFWAVGSAPMRPYTENAFHPVLETDTCNETLPASATGAVIAFSEIPVSNMAASEVADAEAATTYRKSLISGAATTYLTQPHSVGVPPVRVAEIPEIAEIPTPNEISFAGKTAEVHVPENVSSLAYRSAPELTASLKVPPSDQMLPDQNDLKIHRWAFYAAASPEFAFNMSGPIRVDALQNDQGDITSRSFDYSSVESSFLSSGSQNTPGEILSVRFPRTYFHAEAGAEYYLKPRLGLKMGLGYAVSGYGIFQKGSLDPSVADQLANGPAGQVVITRNSFDFQPDEKFRVEQIEIPVGVNYYLRSGRTSLVFSAGISANRTVSRSTAFQANSAELAKVYGSNTLASLPIPDAELLVYRKYHFCANAGVNFQYQILPSWALTAGPEIKYQLTPVFGGSASENQLPYRVGFQAGVKFFPFR